MTRVGITGTRMGASDEQLLRLDALLHEIEPEVLHHGDCWGVDAQANDLAIERGIPVVIHPPENLRYWADCEMAEGSIRLPSKPYLERNKDIVDACDILIAVPSGPERLRSGTWSTVRYAREQGREVLILSREIDDDESN